MTVPPDHGAAEDLGPNAGDAVPRSENPYGAGWGKGWGASWAGIPEMENPDQAAPVERLDAPPVEHRQTPAPVERFDPPPRVERSQPPVVGDVELPSAPESFAFPTAGPRQSGGAIGRTVGLVLGALAVLVAIGGLIFWLVNRPSSVPQAGAGDADATTTVVTATKEPVVVRDPGAETQLLRMVPAGYPPGACKPTDPEPGTVATVNCDNNLDPGGPTSSTYLLARDQAAVDAALATAIRRDAIVTCPGNMQSPGPWRRNATPQKVSGTLVCGIENNVPAVAWSDVDRKLISVVRADSPGPTLDQIFQWWSSHS